MHVNDHKNRQKKPDKADKPQIYHNQLCSVKIKCQQIKRVGCKGVLKKIGVVAVPFARRDSGECSHRKYF